MKKDIISGTPKFDELNDNNNKLVDQLQIDVTDLEKKLKELNALLCGEKCGGCTNAGCGTCGTIFANCKGVKQMAKDAFEKAKEAKKLLEQKKVDAETLKQRIEEVERQVNQTYASTEEARTAADAARKKGEQTKTKILTLIKDIEDFLNTKFNHPNESKLLARETLGLNISLTPSEVRQLADKIKTAVQNLTVVKKILNESKADLDEAMKLKEEALKAKRFAIKVMNKTQGVLDMLSTTGDLQNSTDRTIKETTKTIEDAKAIINEINKKIGEGKIALDGAQQDVSRLEGEKEELKKKFRENKEALDRATGKYSEAKKKVTEVEKTSDVLKQRYNNTKEELDRKQKTLDDVKRRIAALDKSADASLTKAALKINILNELKRKYTENEIRVQDLSDELRILASKAKTIRNKLNMLSKCHADCNPRLTNDICMDENELPKLTSDGEEELKQIKAEIANRASI